LPLADEKAMWRKEKSPGYVAMKRRKFSEWILDKFTEKPDKPQVCIYHYALYNKSYAYGVLVYNAYAGSTCVAYTDIVQSSVI
jgi:hypothetical protein